MTPLEIIMLLSVHCIGDYRMAGPSEGENGGSPAGIKAAERFRKEGLVEGYQKGEQKMVYKLTGRGNVFVAALMDLPLPVRETKWVMPKTES